MGEEVGEGERDKGVGKCSKGVGIGKEIGEGVEEVVWSVSNGRNTYS